MPTPSSDFTARFLDLDEMMVDFKFLWPRKKEYSPIAVEENQSPADEKFLKETEIFQNPHDSRNSSQTPWMVLTFIFVGLSGLLLFHDLRRGGRGGFDTGFHNDMILARSAIKVSQVKFTGGIKFYDNGTMYRDNGPGPAYVGPPTPEMDDAWEQLIGTRYLAFTEDQKSSFSVRIDKGSADGLYRAGPDTFHSLHCVDKLRQTIDGYLYDIPEKVDERRNNVLHIEHCLDFLRQLVQCTSDLTPIPLVYSVGAGMEVPDFEQVHTCRSFDTIHRWAMKQNQDALNTLES
ncbi:hypothetical protein PV04_08946 [Phialophora macrospora]|uniref:Uncharacterized protein n=1 Tax=Phialophora macrospora TaxID=1851006 RepID=A0A0D2CFT8_9EURO|nr:hypothetical protein PV04_08946 [Phialophora macrospora]